MSYGFFDEIEDKKQRKQNTMIKLPKCGKCGLYKKAVSPKMKPQGKGNKKILIIYASPTMQEDRTGKRMKSGGGRYLKSKLNKIGIDLYKDCYLISAVNCKSGKQTGLDKIENCRPLVLKYISTLKPKVIILLGDAALRSIIGYTWGSDLHTISRWRGSTIPDQTFDCWICPTFNPVFVKQEEDRVVESKFIDDLKAAVSKVDIIPHKEPDSSQTIKILNTRQAVKWLQKIISNKPPLLSFDYETTGLKPHAIGHRIVSVGMCWSSAFAISFMLDEELKSLLKKILNSDKIGKIAANLKFEELWSRHCLNIPVNRWVWDTMLFAHIEDNRSKITGLKFQVYTKYGVLYMDDHISSNLGSTDKSSNGFNKIGLIPQYELLLYGGLDALFEHRLAQEQMFSCGIIDKKGFARSGQFKVAEIDNIVRSLGAID